MKSAGHLELNIYFSLSGDFQARFCAQIARSLREDALTFGMKKIALACQKIEAGCLEVEPPAIEVLLAELQRAYLQVNGYLKDWLGI